MIYKKLVNDIDHCISNGQLEKISALLGEISKNLKMGFIPSKEEIKLLDGLQEKHDKLVEQHARMIHNTEEKIYSETPELRELVSMADIENSKLSYKELYLKLSSCLETLDGVEVISIVKCIQVLLNNGVIMTKEEHAIMDIALNKCDEIIAKYN